ncbi:MAG: VOC family protein [Thermomicrobiales bacterium]
MRNLHPAYRVRDIVRSLAFYETVGFRQLGRVDLEDGTTLLMLNLPGDGDDVTLELVSEPSRAPLEIGDGFSHLAVQVDSLVATLADLTRHGVAVDGPHAPGGESGPRTAFLHDPDGYRIELVQWPDGHPTHLTRADFTP